MAQNGQANMARKVETNQDLRVQCFGYAGLLGTLGCMTMFNINNNENLVLQSFVKMNLTRHEKIYAIKFNSSHINLIFLWRMYVL